MSKPPKPARAPEGTRMVERQGNRLQWTAWGKRVRTERLLEKIRKINRVLHERSPITELIKKRRIELIERIYTVDQNPVGAYKALHDFILLERQLLIQFSQEVERAHEGIKQARTRTKIGSGREELDRITQEALEKATRQHDQLVNTDLRRLTHFERLLQRMSAHMENIRRYETEDKPKRAQREAEDSFDDIYNDPLVQSRLLSRHRQTKGHRWRWNLTRPD